MKTKLLQYAALLATASLISASQVSAVPELMSYQGRVTDADGTLIGDDAPVNRDVFFRLYTEATGGEAIYAETQSVTISGGEFSVLIGNGTGISGSPGPSNPASPSTSINQVINSAGNALYLGITVDDGNSGTANPEIAPRQQLVSGAFAVRAGMAETVASGAVTEAMLGTSSVATGNIQTRAINSSKVADGGISTLNIANAAITIDKLDTDQIGVWTPSGNNVWRNGNVGIGQSNPGFPLNFPNTTGNKIALHGNSGNHYGLGIASGLLQIYTAHDGADVAFGHGHSGNFTENMRIRGNGNVGIGTKAPTQKLHVNGGSAIIQNNANPYLKLTSGGSGYSDLALAGAAGSFSNSSSANDTVLRASNQLHLQSGTGASALTINSGNNVSMRNKVGIGNSSPNANLTVGANLGGSAHSSTLTTNAGALGTSSDSELLLASFGATTASFSSLGISAYRRPAGSNWESASMLLAMNVDSSKRPGGYLAFTSSGLGVKTLDTSHGQLSVSGGITAVGSRKSTAAYATMSYREDRGGIAFDVKNTSQGGTTATKSFSFDGDSNIDFYSDRRLKKDIESAEPMLDRLMELPFRRFRWKDGDEDQKHEFGVIAQEVKPLFPDIVGESGDGILTVGYGTFAIIASKALQELKVSTDAEIDALKIELDDKDERIDDLEARLAALEELILSSR